MKNIIFDWSGTLSDDLTLVHNKKEGRANLLKGMADEVFEFKDMGEFKGKLKEIKNDRRF